MAINYKLNVIMYLKQVIILSLCYANKIITFLVATHKLSNFYIFISECVTVMVDNFSSSVSPFTASKATPLEMKEPWLSQRP